MNGKQLLEGISYQLVGNQPIKDIEAIAFDSRKVKPHTLFVAIKGVQTDGHLYIDKAIENGATVIICEQIENPKAAVSYLIVEDSAHTLGVLAKNFYGDPSSMLKLVGVTGTNGKTTTVTLLHQLFTKLGYKVGLISTVANKIGEEILPSTHTTPDVLALNELLIEMNEAGCEFAFMEVSSHAIVQERIAGIHFEGAVFSNISHDHLDYHETFQNYIYAKKKFFDELPSTAFALTNIDDKRGRVMLQNTVADPHTYALQAMADFKAKVIENALTGLVLQIDGEELYARLVGDFNAYNLLAVYATARLLEADKIEVLTAISTLQTAEGRFDFWQDKRSGIIGIIDYAHTPDALQNVLETLHKVDIEGNIITVVGCGGDRDTTKRPKMAKVACQWSQQVILTSDNPRTEEPEAILQDMQEGVPSDAVSNVLTITNRRQAIRTACKLAQKGDVVLVAGKGHEKYQEIMGVKHPFDDKEELNRALSQ